MSNSTEDSTQTLVDAQSSDEARPASQSHFEPWM